MNIKNVRKSGFPIIWTTMILGSPDNSYLGHLSLICVKSLPVEEKLFIALIGTRRETANEEKDNKVGVFLPENLAPQQQAQVGWDSLPRNCFPLFPFRDSRKPPNLAERLNIVTPS